MLLDEQRQIRQFLCAPANSMHKCWLGKWAAESLVPDRGVQDVAKAKIRAMITMTNIEIVTIVKIMVSAACCFQVPLGASRGLDG